MIDGFSFPHYYSALVIVGIIILLAYTIYPEESEDE